MVSYNCGLPFSRRNYFSQYVYYDLFLHVGEGFDYINEEGTHTF